jgi:hypothetical protein
MRLAAPLATVVLLAALLAGCGSNGGGSSMTTNAAPKANGSSAPAGATARDCKGEGSPRATGMPCGEARRLQGAWKGVNGCAPGAGASRSSCTIEGYRCLSVVTAKGVSVSCAKPGRSVAFTAQRN